MTTIHDNWWDYDLMETYAIDAYPVLPLHRIGRVIGFALFFKSISWIGYRGFHLEVETAFRVSSICHAMLAFGISLHLFTLGTQPFYPIPKTYCLPIPNAESLFCISNGYFVYDLYKNITKHGGLAFIVHGMFCITIFAVVSCQPCGQRLGVACLFYEGSTIWLHTYAFLYYNGYNTLAGYVRLLFAATFFVLRIVFGLYITFEAYDILVFRRVFVDVDNHCCHPVLVFIGLFVNILFHILNFYWFAKIIEKALEAFKGGKNLTQLEKGKELDFDKYRNTALKKNDDETRKKED